MKISINYSEGILSIPLAVLEKAESIGENELKLLLYICSDMGKTMGNFKPEAAATALGMPLSKVESAIAYLRGTGLVKVSGKGAPAKEENETPASPKNKVTVVSNAPPQYSGPELDRMVHEKKPLDILKNESENLFSRPLRHAELNMLVTMYDYFGFDEAYILQLLTMSKDKSQPMKYAYTIAVAYYEKNIVTYEALLEQIAKEEAKNSFETKMKKLFGIEQRSLSTKEKKFFEVWSGYDLELVTYAFELTVDSTGKASMPYMNKILTSFEEQGIKSAMEARESNKKHKEEKSAQKTETGFDEKDFFNIALDSTYKKTGKKI